MNIQYLISFILTACLIYKIAVLNLALGGMRAYSAPEVRHAPGQHSGVRVASVAGPAARLAMGGRMAVRILRWAACCIAVLFLRCWLSGVALSYANRRLVPVTAGTSPMFSRRSAGCSWGRGGGGLFCWRYGQRGLVAAPGRCAAAGRPRGS